MTTLTALALILAGVVIGFLICAMVTAGKIQDAWSVGYSLGLERGETDAVRGSRRVG